MIDNVNDETVRAVAHHEGAHIVIACVRGLAIDAQGMTVFGHPPDPTGVALFEGATPKTEVADAKVDNVVIALLAGGIAHRRFQDDVRTAVLKDEDRIAELLGAPSITCPEIQDRLGRLRAIATELVDRHWDKIQKVATKLCDKPWHRPSRHTSFFKDKSLSGDELKELLDPLPVVIDEVIE